MVNEKPPFRGVNHREFYELNVLVYEASTMQELAIAGVVEAIA